MWLQDDLRKSYKNRLSTYPQPLITTTKNLSIDLDIVVVVGAVDMWISRQTSFLSALLKPPHPASRAISAYVDKLSTGL